MKDTKKIYKSLVFLKILAKPIYFIRESKTNDKLLIKKQSFYLGEASKNYF